MSRVIAEIAKTLRKPSNSEVMVGQEMELQKLVLVHLKLPSSSLWFEPPTIVRWQPEKKIWSTEGFYDIKFDEGKQTLSFRTISFGIFALSAFRFSNLPLQSWELS